MTALSGREREALAAYVNGTYSCACEGPQCPTLPCANEREDAFTVVAAIVAARESRVRAAMDSARATRPSTSAEDWQTLDGRERHGYRRGMAAALDRVGAALSADPG